MKVIKSQEDVQKAALPADLHVLVTEAIQNLIAAYSEYGGQYEPDAHGYILVAEPGDESRDLSDAGLPYRLADVPWEAVQRHGHYFYGIYLANNDFGLGVYADSRWVNGAARRNLEANLDP